ncbi:DUF6366 family protein [Lentibacillus songyuanensis]
MGRDSETPEERRERMRQKELIGPDCFIKARCNNYQIYKIKY